MTRAESGQSFAPSLHPEHDASAPVASHIPGASTDPVKTLESFASHDRVAPPDPAISDDASAGHVAGPTLNLLRDIVADTSGRPASTPWWFESLGSEDFASQDDLAKHLSDRLQVPIKDVPLIVSSLISQIDILINDQLNVIMYDPAFQKLEASWRGLHLLVSQCAGFESVYTKVLNVSWADVTKDIERAAEFDQSNLFKKIYEEEFGIAGGKPYGCLIGDYYVQPDYSADHPIDDLATLRGLSAIAAAAFAPFITSVAPSMLGLTNFNQLERPLDIDRIFEGPAFAKWRSLRDSDDARFLGLVLPRILLRKSWAHGEKRGDGFCYREHSDTGSKAGPLWGNAIWAFATVVARTFDQTGWVSDIRGVERDFHRPSGGMVAGLPVESFDTEPTASATKPVVDVIVTDRRERDLAGAGFISLCQCKDTEYAVFYNAQSIQKFKKYDTESATTNARLSAMLQYILSVSRFAHYLKVLGRDKVGSFAEASKIEEQLLRWLSDWISPGDQASPEWRARYPLKQAAVAVEEVLGRPGTYACTMHLLPHSQFDALTASIELKTELRVD